MSINLHISAIIECTVNATGDNYTVTHKFELYQTPSDVSRKLYEATSIEGILTGYIDWVKSRPVYCDISEPVYAAEDIWAEDSPTRYVTINYGQVHIDELLAWISDQETQYSAKIVFSIY